MVMDGTTPPQADLAHRGRRRSDRDEADNRKLLARLEGAAERGEFSLAYQRQMSPEGDRLVGVECLLRWTSPESGRICPEAFIPVAEKYGVIRPVTRWVIDTLIAETGALEGLTVSFNASAVEFADPSFVGDIAALLKNRGFDPSRLEIEVTETAILADAEVVHRNMRGLHDLGVRIALDDFGVGYSSLNHLRLFPFDTLKIDKAFVAECGHAAESAALINAVVGLGKALGMKVVAEGVESEQQLTFLRAAGVDAVQGFMFGKAIPAERLAYAFSQPIQPLRTPLP
jgi:EAL domain-containing protein (putative c-di-GMP-specific phosphodiesterase class I)